MSIPFSLEDKYLIFKHKDIDAFLSATERTILHLLANKIYDKRQELELHVVEDKCPEYESIWEMIERRVNG